MSEVKSHIAQIELNMRVLEKNQDLLGTKIDTLLKTAGSTTDLMKYVIVPLITILGVLVGVKLVFPS